MIPGIIAIIIGIAAIIAIVSTIQGTNEQIRKNLIGSGRNNIEVRLCEGEWEYEYSSGIPAGISALTEDTGFTPDYSFEEAIEETVKWYKEERA